MWLAALAALQGCIGETQLTEPEPSGVNRGSLTVTTITTGEALDPDGYDVVIDEGTAQPIGVNDSRTFYDLVPTTHQLLLMGVAENCTVEDSNQATVTIFPGTNSAHLFRITCQ